MRWKRICLCIPGIVLCCADGCITLLGQPAEYWSGGFATVREGNPLAAWLLTVHPLAFAAAALPYLAGFVGAVLVLPQRWAVALAIAVAIAHAVGVITWTLVLLPDTRNALFSAWAAWAHSR
jgi:hypothetical protein